ncbi:MAG: hypothetical protein JXA42_14680 [Anaerolineales bacterium]|nr:hypothetical protein [Anaerolineales bacterium]
MKKSIRITKQLQPAFLLIGLLFLLPACNPILELGIESTPTPLPTETPVTPATPTPIAEIPTVIPTPIPTETSLPPSPTAEVYPTITPTPESESREIVDDTTNRYTNDAYGFSFVYPNTWQIKKDSHTVLLGMDSVTLFIGFRWLSESVDIFSRSGLPAGDLETRGEVTILGETVLREALVYNDQVVAVCYGGAPSNIYAGDMLFSISFDVLDPNIDENILNTAQTTADQILESMEFVKTPSLKAGEIPVVGWYGSVHSDEYYGDYLELLPEGAGAIGVEGADEAVEAQILALLDKEPPNKYAHFWGKLTCEVDDHNSCTLTASKIRPDGPGPLFDPDPVEGWIGTISSTPEMAQIDDTFTTFGVYQIQYGLWAEDPAVDAQIVELRDSGTPVRVWGQVFCGVIDANGCQIQVTQINSMN